MCSHNLRRFKLQKTYTRILKTKDESASWKTIFSVMNYKNLQG